MTSLYGRRINISDILQVQVLTAVIACTIPKIQHGKAGKGGQLGTGNSRNEVRWDHVCCILYFFLICILHNQLKSQLPTIRSLFLLFFFSLVEGLGPAQRHPINILNGSHQALEPPGTTRHPANHQSPAPDARFLQFAVRRFPGGLSVLMEAILVPA